ncbi:MAG TPA: FG-GAP-like repeat-containing protein [Pyrinomonadaceae bacterium]|nr:FG-GAP-like repeat-containing protein [Pyrinomonadaceae bacterium]
MEKTFLKISFALLLSLVVATTADAGVLTVNDTLSPGGCDSKISFSEAVLLAREGIIDSNRSSLTNGEKGQITNATLVVAPTQPACDLTVAWIIVDGVGPSSADDIVFSVNSGFSVPIDLGQNDDINGLQPSGARFIIDGTGFGTNRHCIKLADNSGSQIRNVELRNCTGGGIWGQAVNGAIFEGLSIHNNASDGISIGFSSTLTQNSRNVRIGGDQPQHRNLIYANAGNGVFVTASATQDRSVQNINILNNYIGTSNGTSDNGNTLNGVALVNPNGVNVGDQNNTTRNIISGNNNDGVNISGSGAVGINVIGNFIGVDSSGAVALGNSASGVALLSAAGQTANFVTTSPNRIGTAGKGNVISGNGYGIFISDANTSNNWVEDNYIGTNLGANTDVGNVLDGVHVTANAINNRIGGTGGIGNVIAFNATGIRAPSGTRNRFQQNRVFSNDNLGIDLGTAGVTANDTGDSDTGANDLQNFPALTNVYATSSTVRLQGTLNSIPSKPFVIEFFGNTSSDSSGYGEGRNFLGETTVITNGSGNGTFDVTFNVPIATTAQYVTATATDENGNTSEYSLLRNICADVSLSAPGFVAFAQGASSAFTYFRSTGCPAVSAQANVSWITVTGSSAGTVSFTVAQNTGPQRGGTISVFYNNGQFSTFVNFNVTQLAGMSKAPYDFEGDGKTDISIFRPGSGQWWYLRSSDGGNRAFTFGLSSDRQAPVDFTGDGKADIGFWRPTTGEWYVLRSEDSTFYAFPFGANGDVPVPGDFDGDNKADAAVFRPSSATWFISRSTGGTTIQPFGVSTDIPVRGDFDGDGKSDIAIFRPSNGQWWILRSSNGSSFVAAFGLSSDKLVPGDYTGDGKTDVAFWRPSTGDWYVMRSEDMSFYAVPFGTNGDVPVSGDYDGDGKWDTAVFRPSNNTWFVQRSTAGTLIQAFGTTGDKAVPSVFVP